jgi:hypothetical protein
MMNIHRRAARRLEMTGSPAPARNWRTFFSLPRANFKRGFVISSVFPPISLEMTFS